MHSLRRTSPLGSLRRGRTPRILAVALLFSLLGLVHALPPNDGDLGRSSDHPAVEQGKCSPSQSADGSCRSVPLAEIELSDVARAAREGFGVGDVLSDEGGARVWIDWPPNGSTVLEHVRWGLCVETA